MDRNMAYDLQIPSLYYHSLQACSDNIINNNWTPNEDLTEEWMCDYFPAAIISHLMEAVILRNREYKEANKIILFTPTVKKGIIRWSLQDFEILIRRCSNLKELIICGNEIEERKFAQNIELLVKQCRIERIIFISLPFELNIQKDFKHTHLHRMPTIYTYAYQKSYHSLMLREMETVDQSAFRLNELYIQSLEVHVEGIKAILTNCPTIQILRHNNLAAALYSLYTTGVAENRYRLRNLEMKINEHLPPHNAFAALMLCTEICPDIKIVCCDLSEKVYLEWIILPLLSFKDLGVLKVASLRRSLFSHKTIFSVLEKHGHSLQILELETLAGLNVQNLLTTCPNLQSLHLHDRLHYGYSVAGIEWKNFTRFKELKLFGERTYGISELGKMLLNRALVSIQLSNIRIELQVLDKVMKNTYFPNLVLFQVSGCDSLELGHVVSLLDSESPMKFLSICQCKKIGELERKALLQYVGEIEKAVDVVINV